MSSLMIFAAGFGKRLHPLTLDVPKSLVPIQNIPVLDYILKSYYKKTSLSSVTINTHYKAEMIREFIKIIHSIKFLNLLKKIKFWEQGKDCFTLNLSCKEKIFGCRMQIFYVILNHKNLWIFI